MSKTHRNFGVVYSRTYAHFPGLKDVCVGTYELWLGTRGSYRCNLNTKSNTFEDANYGCTEPMHIRSDAWFKLGKTALQGVRGLRRAWLGQGRKAT
jgi:hypothetical protein